jgi:hypothetical protein
LAGTCHFAVPSIRVSGWISVHRLPSEAITSVNFPQLAKKVGQRHLMCFIPD